MAPREVLGRGCRRPARFLRGVVGLGLVAAGAGCAAILGFEDTTLREGDEGGVVPTVDGGADATAGEGGAGRVSVRPTNLVVRRGKSADLALDLVRGPNDTGTYTFTLEGLPAGVTAAPATLDGAATTTTLTVAATAGATLGSSAARVVTSGSGGAIAPLDVALLVADASGSHDTTFDGDGVVLDSSKGAASTFFAVALTAEGNVVAGGAGLGAGANAGWLLRRYSATGAPDATFNAVAAAAVPKDGELRAIAIEPTGRIVCVGTSSPGVAQQTQLTIARFNPNGSIDATFAPPTGIVRMPAGESILGSNGYGVALQPDGAIIVVGARRTAGVQEVGIAARFKSDGTRDGTFNAGTTIAIPDARLVGAAVEPGGNIVFAGSSTGGALPAYLLTRRTSAGAVDPGFGTAGTTTFGNTYRANGFVRLPSGELALVGDVRQGTAAYTAGVTSDKGAAIFARAFANVAAAGFYGVAAQDEGRFVAAGHVAALNGEARVERILADGGKDGTFSDAGTAVIEPGGVPNNVEVGLYAVAVQKDGRIVVAGNRSGVGGGGVVHRIWP